MKLPQIDLPIYEAVLPSSGEKVKFRAFTVKEEKIMLIAKESQEPEQIVLSIKQVIGNCLIDKNIDELAVFDLEYILLMVRSKSVSNVVDFVVNDPDTDEEVQLKLNIDNVKIIRDERHSDKIKLNDQYTMIMKYPNYDLYMAAIKGMVEKDSLVYYNIMISCIDRVASSDAVYKFSEFSKEEIDQFIENLESDVIDKIQLFFETMPKLRHELKYTNSNNEQKVFVVEGTESFFM